jgi:hypothetical protein
MKKNFTQLCVWPGTVVGKENIQEFEKYFKDEFDVNIKYETEVKTLPDVENGKAVPDTGGRNDLFFYIHSDDINKFAIQRLSMGIRWWEDVMSYYNKSSHLYSNEFIEKYPKTW